MPDANGRESVLVDRNPDAGTFYATYSYPSRPPSLAVPMAIQELTGRGPTDLEPMHYATSVDPDALDELFRPTPNEPEREATVSFTYHDYAIAVKGYGRIVLRSPEARKPSATH